MLVVKSLSRLKNEDHSLKCILSHIKPFQLIVFIIHTPPVLSCQKEGGSVMSLVINELRSKNAFYVILRHFMLLFSPPPTHPASFSLSKSKQSESSQIKFPSLKSLVVGWWWLGGSELICLIIVSSLAHICQGLS